MLRSLGCVSLPSPVIPAMRPANPYDYKGIHIDIQIDRYKYMYVYISMQTN